MAIGGKREGAGRKPRPYKTVRLGLKIEAAFLARIDQARQRIKPPKGITRAAFLRDGLALVLEQLETLAGGAFNPPMMEGKKIAFPLELPEDLHGRAQVLVAAGRAASLIDLIRSGGAGLAAKVGC